MERAFFNENSPENNAGRLCEQKSVAYQKRARQIRDLIGTVAAANHQLPISALPSGGYGKLVDRIRQKISDLQHR
jgi:hypothetical protein